MIGPSFVKRINQARILNLLRVKGGLSRAGIARELKLTRSTVSVLASDLMEKGIISESSEYAVHSTGRPSVSMQLHPEGGHFVGVDVGVERIRVITINLMVETLSDISKPLATREPEGVLKQVVDMVNSTLSNKVINRTRLRGVGLTIPGILNREHVVEHALVLGWRNVDIRPRLEEQLQVPIYIENDANAAALAEFYFGGTDVEENLFYLLLDVGVGGGMIIDGSIYTGSFGTAGEIGHMQLPLRLDSRGEFRTVSIEDCIGKRALLDQYRQNSGSGASFSVFCSRVDKGEPAAVQTITCWAGMVALGLVNIIDLINPSHIILGGPLSRFYQHVQKPLAVLSDRDPFPGAKSVQLLQSRFGEDACVMGAAAIVYESLFKVNQPG